MKYYAIIVAGGNGTRMNSELPKQFMLLNGTPIIMHSIKAFHDSDLKPEIFLVLNPSYQTLWSSLCKEHRFNIPVTLINSGSERFHSVKNAVDLINETSIVAIHDAVRPIVPNELITRTFLLAGQFKAVVPATACKESIREKIGDTTVSLRRENFLLVQTPQVFQSQLLKKAYQQEYNEVFTDDASVVEKTGINVSVTEGDYRNIKITFPEDIKVAELYLQNMA